MAKQKLSCGCVRYKKDTHKCAKCKSTCCGEHIYSWVDGNNAAITLNAPELCESCYAKTYPDDYQRHQADKLVTARDIQLKTMQAIKELMECQHEY